MEFCLWSAACEVVLVELSLWSAACEVVLVEFCLWSFACGVKLVECCLWSFAFKSNVSFVFCVFLYDLLAFCTQI